jgi:endonuclease G
MAKRKGWSIHRRLVRLALLILLALGGAPAFAFDEPPCTDAQEAEADKWLWLNARDRRISLRQNLPWGAPKPTAPTTKERTLVHWDYVIRHDGDLKVPIWTAERVIGANLGKAARSDCFRKDPRLTDAQAAVPVNYDEPIFDQGHMTPSGNMTTSKISVWNSFVMSNMTPQFCQFNRGTWQILEELTRRWAIQRGTIHIVNGSIFDRDNDGARDPDASALLMKPNAGARRVAIPTAFYKVIAHRQPDGTVETLSFLLPHDRIDRDQEEAVGYLTDHIADIADIERLSSTDLLPNAGQVAQSTALWPFNGSPPRSLAGLGTQCKATANLIVD